MTCGPTFDINRPIKVIGQDPATETDVVVPIPHAYFQSALAENYRGRLKLWSFIIPNAASDKDLSECLVKTTEVERRAGLELWDKLHGQKGDKLKSRVTKMWDLQESRGGRKETEGFGRLIRQRKREQLRHRPADRERDVLLALVQVGHRCPDRARREIE